jgi:hypothetical protein
MVNHHSRCERCGLIIGYKRLHFIPVLIFELMLGDFWTLQLSSRRCLLQRSIGCFSLFDRYLLLTLQWVFIRLSKGYYRCDHLPSFRHRWLNLPNTWHITQCWQSIGLAHIYQARKKHTVLHNFISCWPDLFTEGSIYMSVNISVFWQWSIVPNRW